MNNYVDNPFDTPAILSICPGLLGLERGLIRAIGAIRTVAYVEIEAFIIENLVAAMEAGVLAPAPIWTDVKTFDGKPFRGKIHGIIGGYPCQPFSNAGNRLGTEDPRHLYPFISGIIETTGPIWCFFENVSGHLSLGFDTVYQDLERMGYAVEVGIYTAEEVGAPHQRERLFILAIKREYLANARNNDRRLSESTGWQQSPQVAGSGESVADTLSIRSAQGFNKGQHQQSDQDAFGRKTELVNSYNNGYDATQNGESTDKGNDYSAPGSDDAIQSSRSGGKHKKNELVDASRSSGGDVCREFGEITEGKPNHSHTGVGQADTCVLNAQGNKPACLNTEEWQKQRERPVGSQSIVHRWPARPGEPQHCWEPPRTVESGLGLHADGYSFREDILRGLGNMVVEQTAEIAFIDLLKKHFYDGTQHKHYNPISKNG